MALGSAGADAGVGERAWRFSGWVRAVGNFSAGPCLELVQSETEPDRRTSAETSSAKQSAGSGVGVNSFGGGEPGQSLRMEAALARVPLSVGSLPDGSYRGVSVA